MYVIDLLCDALALRAPDRLFSEGGCSPKMVQEREERERTLMERGEHGGKGSLNRKRIQPARLLVLCVIRLG